MSGYATYQRLQRIEAQAKMLGFRLGNPKNGNWGGAPETDMVSLYPDNNSLPVYSRDADIFTGSFRDVEIFLTGWVRSQSYDQMLRLSDDKKRKKAEAKEIERQRIIREKAEQRKTFAILADKSEAEVEKL